MNRIVINVLFVLILCSCGEKKRQIYFDSTIGKSVNVAEDIISIPYEERGGVKFIKVRINGIELDMIIDSGSSSTLISSAEANYLLQKGWISDDGIKGTRHNMIADGSVMENTVIVIDELIIGGKISCKNVEACVSESVNAPLLLGNEVLDRLASYTVNNVSKEIEFKLK